MSRRSREELEAEIERLEARIEELEGDEVTLELADGGALQYTPGEDVFVLAQDPDDPGVDVSGNNRWYISAKDLEAIRAFLDDFEAAIV